MKKFLFNTLLSAIALIGGLMFTACSDKDSEGLNQDPTPGSSYVPVQFVFNVGMGTDNANGQTRMSSQTVQAGGENFRGIYAANILAYHLEDANGNSTNGKHVASPIRAIRKFNLSNIVGTNELSKDNSTRVIELSLPNGTNSLMFYGRAPKDGD